MDPQRLRGLARASLNVKDGQPIANDGSIGSPMQSTSSKVWFFYPPCLMFHECDNTVVEKMHDLN